MARLYDYSHHTSPNSAPHDREHHLLLVGGGPRSVIQLTAEVCFLYTYRRHFTQLADLGAQYSLRTTLVEKQPTIAPGAAFAHGHTGMANTGVESDITFPLPPPDPTSSSIQHMLSYQYRFTNLIAKTAPQYYQQLQQLNFPGSIMFRRSLGPMSATPSGTPDYSFAFLMRRTIGEEEVQTFQHVKSLANQLPFYKLDLLSSTQLHSITTRPCDAPRAHVRHLATGTATTLTADQIRLNTGTILRHPVSDPAVRQFTFAQPMNVSDMSRFFAQHHLLAPPENHENPSSHGLQLSSPRKNFMSPFKNRASVSYDKPPVVERNTSLPSEPPKEILKSKTKMRKDLALMYLRNNALEQTQVQLSTTIDELSFSLKQANSENMLLNHRIKSLEQELNQMKNVEERIEKERWRQFCNRN